MPPDERRRQAALQRKVTRRKEAKKTARRDDVAMVVSTSERAIYKTSGRWPLHEVLIARDLRNDGGLVQVVVARRSPESEVAVGVFLVDLGCLGVKDAFGRVFDSPAEYERTLRARLVEVQEMRSTDLNVAARVIQESVAYARRWGFEPHRDYAEAAVVLAGADPAASGVTVPLGRNGKPLYVSGPRDNARRIVAQLERVAGPGNYDYIVNLGG